MRSRFNTNVAEALQGALPDESLTRRTLADFRDIPVQRSCQKLGCLLFCCN